MWSRTLRARDHGAADDDPLLARREAPHHPRIEPTPGGTVGGFPAPARLICRPIGHHLITEGHTKWT